VFKTRAEIMLFDSLILGVTELRKRNCMFTFYLERQIINLATINNNVSLLNLSAFL
jgi:hypothetical protein